MSAAYPATWPAAAHALLEDRPELGGVGVTEALEAVISA